MGQLDDSLTAFVSSAPNAQLVREALRVDSATLLGLIAALHVSDTRSDWPAPVKAGDA